jgi:ketosteroid isomerase-like protein
MSQENVEVVRELYDALNRRDWEAALPLVSAEVEWEPDARHPKAGVHRGRAAYRGFLEDIERPFETTVIESEEFFVRDDQVVAFIKIRRRPTGSSAEVAIQIGELGTLRDGKIVRGQGFGEREKALEAVGLSE